MGGWRVLNYYGDGSLCTFPSATGALNCAIELQKELQADPHVPLRIGLHIGEVLFEDGKALGDGVNVASRIQSLRQANTILFSKEIFDKIRNHPEFKPASLGMFDFKNVDEPVEVFALANEGLVVPKRKQMSGKLKRDLSKKKYAYRRNLIAGATVVILLIAAAAIMLFAKYFNHQNNAIEKSIAVLPFVNMSNDSQQDYFADGMMDEVLNHLYKIGGLKVTSRTSSLTYKGSKKTSREIADELGVGNLLEGSVQKDDDHIRIIAQLINGKTDDHLWAETYVREFKDIFSIQSDIAQQIASALKIKIDPAVKERIELKPTENTEAYSLFLRAHNEPPVEENKLFLETAIALDSTFADAYVDLALYWIFNGGYNGNKTAQEVIKNAKPLLQKAIQLNPNLASAHVGLSFLNLYYLWDFEGAGNEYQKVRQLNPSNPELIGGFVDYLLAMGKVGEAMELASNAFERDSLHFAKELPLANYYNGNLRTATGLIGSQYSLNKSSQFYWTNFIRINIYAGEYNNAVLAFEQNKDLYGPNFTSLALGYAGIAYYKTGRKDSTEKLINIIKARSERSQIGSPSFCIAAIYSVMGEIDLAIKWLQKAYNDHEVEMYWLKVEPPFIPLHNDPRFKELLTKIGFK